MTPKQFEKWLKSLDKQVAGKMSAVLVEGGNKIKKEAVNTITKNSFDTGALANSIESTANIVAETITQVIIGSTLTYAPFVEYGSKSHKTSNGSAEFKQDLKKWCERNGFPFYPVYRKIVMKGIEEKPYLIPAFNKIAPRVTKALEKVLKEIK